MRSEIEAFLEKVAMHDSLLIDICVDWKKGLLEINFRGYGTKPKLIAEGLFFCRIPRKKEWGFSDSVNDVTDLIKVNEDIYSIEIQMQSGDDIYIEAEYFTFKDTKCEAEE